MSLEKSNLNEAVIIELLLNKYGIAISEAVEILRTDGLGTSNYFKLLSKEGDYYFIKEYKSVFTFERINEGAEVVKHLTERDFPAAEILKTKDDELIFEFEGRYICLQKFISGKIYACENSLPDNLLIHSAKLLGKLHSYLDGYIMKKRVALLYPVDWITSNDYFRISKNLYDMIIKIDEQNLPSVNTQIKDDIIYLINLSQKICACYHCFDKMTFASTHSDYVPGQFICDENEEKIKAVIDFDDPASMPIPFLLMRNYMIGASEFNNADYIDIEKLGEYIKGYIKYSTKKPTNDDIKLMPYAALYFAFTDACFFYQHFFNELTDLSTKYIKRVRYFDKNADKLSKELCKYFSIDNYTSSIMKIIVVCMIKDESDIIESFIRYYAIFCDEIIIYDDNSSDKSKDIIRNLIKEGLNVLLIENESSRTGLEQKLVYNDLLELAFRKHHADWVLPIDADEFLISINGENPRVLMEKLDYTKGYQLLSRNYIAVDNPQENSVFLPSIYNEYYDSKLEGNVFKVIINKKQFFEYHVKISTGQHQFIYDEKNKCFEIECHNELRLAHYQYRSYEQAIKKIVFGNTKYYLDRDARRGFGIHYVEPYNQIKNGNVHNLDDIKKLFYPEEICTGKFIMTECENIVLSYTNYKESSNIYGLIISHFDEIFNKLIDKKPAPFD